MNGNGTATRTVDPRVGRSLTAREDQVLRLIAAGAFTSEIAAQLWVSETTVAYHVRQILAKLEANNRAHAVAIMLRAELLEAGARRAPELGRLTENAEVRRLDV